LACTPCRISCFTSLRYEDRTQLYKIGDLLPAIYATVEGEVLNCNITFGGRRMMTCQISDGTGILTMRFSTSARR
jgi:ATP-dependent DNA helicase RecG